MEQLGYPGAEVVKNGANDSLVHSNFVEYGSGE
jgi:hypothetical protein